MLSEGVISSGEPSMQISLLGALMIQLAHAPPSVAHPALSCDPDYFSVEQALNGVPLTGSSGDFRIDAYLALAFATLADMTGLYPSVLFDTRSSTGDMLAVPPQPSPDNPDRWGRIVLRAEPLRRQVQGSDHGLYVTVGIVSHEFGHVLQFHSPGTLLTSPLLCELHADFMAGYFLGALYPELSPERLSAFVRAAQAASDVVHGTPAERERAIRAGYSARAMTPSDAFVSGEIFLLTGSVPSPQAAPPQQ
jgi:hypothetical protein